MKKNRAMDSPQAGLQAKKRVPPIQVTYDCIPCAIGSLITLFNKGLVPAEKRDATMRTLLRYLSEIDFNQSPPKLGREMHRIIRQVLNNPDPYLELKMKFNQSLLDLYPELKRRVAESPDPFQLALRLAIAGNVIDFGPNQSFDLNGTLEKANSVTLAVDDSSLLRQSLHRAKTLLYLGDNAGEIVMDRIFLETMGHPHVYFAVRGAPIINDVTEVDAGMVGIDKIATVISNGDDAPGTVLESVSPQFRRIFDQADLIISKGQGNYESLCGSEKNIFFLLMAKCDHVASHLGVKKGDFVVKKM